VRGCSPLLRQLGQDHVQNAAWIFKHAVIPEAEHLVVLGSMDLGSALIPGLIFGVVR